MEGMQVDSLRMDPCWNQYWQQSMLMNSMYAQQAQQDTLAQQAQQQALLAQQGVNASNTTFQANPQEASATTNIQAMQEEAPKKGKGWKIGGIITAVGATALLICANRKGGGNIAQGLKRIWGGVKGKADGLFNKAKTIGEKKVVLQEGKINRIKDIKALEALGGKGTLDVNSANTVIRKYTGVVDDVAVTVSNGNVIKSIGKDGKAVEISGELETKIADFIKKVDANDANTIAKLKDLEYVNTDNGIRTIFTAAKAGDTPVFSHGVSKWFPEQIPAPKPAPSAA